MRKNKFLLTVLSVGMFLFFFSRVHAQNLSCDKQWAADYANDFWNKRNPQYCSYGDPAGTPRGSDCANFVSQALIEWGYDLSGADGYHNECACVPDDGCFPNPFKKPTIGLACKLFQFLDFDQGMECEWQEFSSGNITVPDWFEPGDLVFTFDEDGIICNDGKSHVAIAANGGSYDANIAQHSTIAGDSKKSILDFVDAAKDQGFTKIIFCHLDFDKATATKDVTKPKLDLDRTAPPDTPFGWYCNTDPEVAWAATDNCDQNSTVTVDAYHDGIQFKHLIGGPMGTLSLGSLRGQYMVNANARDESGNVDVKTINFTVGCPVMGRPDDTQEISLPTPDSVQSTPGADIAILREGYKEDAASLLKNLQESFELVSSQNMTLETFKKHKLLLLPSGSLHTLAKTTLFQELLKQYVQEGGTLLVFTQSQGSDFSVLPGAPLGVGYIDDQACHAQSVGVVSPHVVFSGQPDNILDATIDGYLTQLPGAAKVLLRRSKNFQPALVEYMFGQGTVLLSTLYSDFAFLDHQLYSDERRLIQDLLTYALDTKTPIQEFKETEPVSFNVNLTVPTTVTEAVTSGELVVLGPDKQVVKTLPLNFENPLSAGQTIQLPVNLGSPMFLGIYRVSATLKNAAGTILTELPLLSRFAVKRDLPLVTEASLVSVSVRQVEELYPKGSTATFLVDVHNQKEREGFFTLRYITRSHIPEPREVELAIPAGETRTVSVSIPSLRVSDRLLVQAYEGTTLQSDTEERFFVFTPSVQITAQTDKTQYVGGQTVNVNASLTNSHSASYPLTLTLSVLNPDGAEIVTQQKNLLLSATSTQTQAFTFALPSPTLSGPYTVILKATQEEALYGIATTYFEVPKPEVSVTSTLPPALEAGGTSQGSFTVTNTSLQDISTGTLTLTLKDPQNAVVTTQTQSFSVSSQQSVDVPVTLDLTQVSALLFGNYILSYEISTGAGTLKGIRMLPNTTMSLSGSFDKASYRVREPLVFTAQIKNTGSFVQNINLTTSIQGTALTNTQGVTLQPDEEKVVPFSFTLPATLLSGTQSLVLAAALQNTQTQAFTFFIPKSSLSFNLTKLAYTPTESVPLLVKNTGGVDVTASLLVSLVDANENVQKGDSQSVSLQAGEEKTMAFSLFNANLVEGQYRVSVVATHAANEKTSFDRYIFLQGIKATTSISTDKKVYKKGEPVNVSMNVIPTGTLQNATLKLTIKQKKESFATYPQLPLVYAILVDTPLVWFGTANGLVKHDTVKNTWTTYTTANGLADNALLSLSRDAQYIWAGTANGLTRISRTNFSMKNYTDAQGFPSVTITSLASDGNTLWIGTWDGLVKFDKQKESFTVLTTQDGLPENRISSLLVDGNILWVGTPASGLAKLDKITNTFTSVSLPNPRVNALSVDETSLWIATQGGVVKLEKGTLTQTLFTQQPEGLAHNWVYAVGIDGHFVYCGTYAGLSRYDTLTNTWQTFTTAQGLPENIVRVIAPDEERIWLGTAKP